ncbi:hypothetical protein ACU8KH_03777 [Lachancea thermotolerans]
MSQTSTSKSGSVGVEYNAFAPKVIGAPLLQIRAYTKILWLRALPMLFSTTSIESKGESCTSQFPFDIVTIASFAITSAMHLEL